MPDNCPLLTPLTDRLAHLEATTSGLDGTCRGLRDTLDNHIPTLITAATDKVDAAVVRLSDRVHKLELALVFVAGLASGLGILEGIQLLT